jgi:uncharacterized lipoprotein YajG
MKRTLLLKAVTSAVAILILAAGCSGQTLTGPDGPSAPSNSYASASN